MDDVPDGIHLFFYLTKWFESREANLIMLSGALMHSSTIFQAPPNGIDFH